MQIYSSWYISGFTQRVYNDDRSDSVLITLNEDGVHVGDVKVDLRAKELAIFIYISSLLGQVATLDMIIANVYPDGYTPASTDIVRTYVCYIRRKLDRAHGLGKDSFASKMLVTATYNRGYCIVSSKEPLHIHLAQKRKLARVAMTSQKLRKEVLDQFHDLTETELDEWIRHAKAA